MFSIEHAYINKLKHISVDSLEFMIHRIKRQIVYIILTDDFFFVLCSLSGSFCSSFLWSIFSFFLFTSKRRPYTSLEWNLMRWVFSFRDCSSILHSYCISDTLDRFDDSVGHNFLAPAPQYWLVSVANLRTRDERNHCDLFAAIFFTSP